MTTKEYLTARKDKNWKFNSIVDKNSFRGVNRIHPIKQKMVSEIVKAARNDAEVSRIIIFGSSIRYDCDVTSDLDISQSYIKNDITAVHWRSITSGEAMAIS